MSAASNTLRTRSTAARVYATPVASPWLRTGLKRLTMWAYSHGLLSLAVTDWLFGVLQLRSA